MSDTFDPYRKWLGIPPSDQPPDHYRLLGIGEFESDPDVIASAADRQMAHVRTFQSGRHSRLSQQLLNELAGARVCLLDPKKKAAYDTQLQAERARVAAASAGPSPPPVQSGTSGAEPPGEPAFPRIEPHGMSRHSPVGRSRYAVRRRRHSLWWGPALAVILMVITTAVILAIDRARGGEVGRF